MVKDTIKLEQFKQEYHDSTCKVKDLVVALMKMNPEALVMTEGCDCYGNVDNITQEESNENTVTVYINRY